MLNWWKRCLEEKLIGVNFSTSTLTHAVSTWHYLISSTLVPGKSTFVVIRDRAIINYAIQKDIKMNIGKIIVKFILSIIGSKATEGLPHNYYHGLMCIMWCGLQATWGKCPTMKELQIKNIKKTLREHSDDEIDLSKEDLMLLSWTGALMIVKLIYISSLFQSIIAFNMHYTEFQTLNIHLNCVF